MRSLKLWDQLREHQWNKKTATVNGLVQQVNGNWPICQKCKKGVDYAGIEDMGPNTNRPKYVVIRAKCHGEESYYRAEFDYGIPLTSLGTVMGTAKFFGTDHEDDGRRR